MAHTKINKYLALKIIIESNGWSVEPFAVGFGARGYCSRSVVCCLKKLGFNNSLLGTTSKNLVSLPWNALFVSGWPIITKNGLLLLNLKSKTL